MQYSSSDEVKAVVMMMQCSEKFENGGAENIRRGKKIAVAEYRTRVADARCPLAAHLVRC